ncbi:hypothetical protein [Edwardsiella tarda]|uniref:hypothetical protein n=1 Tax=Edwardsiella tarda TaxID=636 RepID=UPI0005587246|nr:hypothetical protein [Edwardsiella tarda]
MKRVKAAEALFSLLGECDETCSIMYQTRDADGNADGIVAATTTPAEAQLMGVFMTAIELLKAGHPKRSITALISKAMTEYKARISG